MKSQRFRSFIIFAVLVAMVILIVGAIAQAQQDPANDPSFQPVAVESPSSLLFSYQGQLLNADGSPITNPEIDMTFKLYDVAELGSACWSEDHIGPDNTVEVEDGLFNVLLGQITTMDTACLTGDVYLELVVGGETLSPRELLTSVFHAQEASNLPDGAKVAGSLEMDGSVIASATNNYLYFRSNHAHVRLSAAGSMQLFIDSNNDQTNATFGVYTNSSYTGAASSSIFTAYENGSVNIAGNLTLGGTCTIASATTTEVDGVAVSSADDCPVGSIQSGAYIESNLQSPLERSSDRIERFERGDTLCWSEDQRLEICNTSASPLVVAVADGNGKPIVLGAEPIKVLGPVTPGDLLISSETAGYAVAWSQLSMESPPVGIVIAKALEAFDGDQGVIKAMILAR